MLPSVGSNTLAYHSNPNHAMSYFEFEAKTVVFIYGNLTN